MFVQCSSKEGKLPLSFSSMGSKLTAIKTIRVQKFSSVSFTRHQHSKAPFLLVSASDSRQLQMLRAESMQHALHQCIENSSLESSPCIQGECLQCSYLDPFLNYIVRAHLHQKINPHFLAHASFRFRNTGLFKPPVEMVGKIVSPFCLKCVIWCTAWNLMSSRREDGLRY